MKTIRSQKALRAAFWGHMGEEFNRRYWHPTMRQNAYTADVRIAWVDFVDAMARTGIISAALAQRGTL